MSDWSGFFSSVLEDLEELGDEVSYFDSRETGTVKDFGVFDFPAVHIIPDRTNYVGNGEYELPFVINLYFERTRGAKYSKYVKTMEKWLEDVDEKIDKNSYPFSFKPVSINYYPGEFENTLIEMVEITYEVKQLQDFGK